MSKNVWESIDDLFNESNGSSKKEEDSVNADDLDQNELIGIIDDEEYQYFLTTEKLDDDEDVNKKEIVENEINKEECREGNESKSSVKSEPAATVQESVKAIDSQDKEAEDSQSEDEDLEKKNLDEDDEEDDEAMSRDKFWSERSSISNDAASLSAQSVVNNQRSRNKIPNLMEQHVRPQSFVHHNQVPMPMRPFMNSQPLLDTPYLLPTPSRALLPTPSAPPLMFLNVGGYQSFNDMDIVRQTIHYNSQQCLLNTPLYTDFSCSQHQNQFEHQFEPASSFNNYNKKRKSEPIKQQQQQLQQPPVNEPSKEPLQRSDSNSNIQPPIKISKSITTEEEPTAAASTIQSTKSEAVLDIVTELDPDYLKKLEQQKRIREAILKKKEERRLQRAQEQKAKEEPKKSSDTAEIDVNKNKENLSNAKVVSPPSPPTIQPVEPTVFIPSPKQQQQPMIQNKVSPMINPVRATTTVTPPQRTQNPYEQQNRLNNNNMMIRNRMPPVSNDYHYNVPPKNNNIYSYTSFNNMPPSNYGIFDNPAHFYSQQNNSFYHRPPPVNNNQSQQIISTHPAVRNFNPNLIRKPPPQPVSKNIQQQPAIINHHSRATIYNLSLSTSQKCIYDLCSNIQLRENVIKINMIMNEKKAEIIFSDRESAEKFFKHYNRKLVDLSSINIKID